MMMDLKFTSSQDQHVSIYAKRCLTAKDFIMTILESSDCASFLCLQRNSIHI